MDFGIRERILLDPGHAVIKCSLELRRQAFALLPIPSVNISNVRVGWGCEASFHSSSLRESRTLSQARPAVGSDR